MLPEVVSLYGGSCILLEVEDIHNYHKVSHTSDREADGEPGGLPGCFTNPSPWAPSGPAGGKSARLSLEEPHIPFVY